MEARRKRPESEDRRGIPRFTDNEIGSVMNAETKLLKYLIGLSVVFAAFEMGYSLKDGLEWGTRGIFFVVAFTTMAVLFYRRLTAVKLYLENNSINNLRQCQETHNNFMIYLATILTVTLAASIFYRL